MAKIIGVRGVSFITVSLKAGSNLLLHNVVMTSTPYVVRFYAVTDNPNVMGAFIVQFCHAEIGEIAVTTVKPLERLTEDEIKDLVRTAEENHAESGYG